MKVTTIVVLVCVFSAPAYAGTARARAPKSKLVGDPRACPAQAMPFVPNPYVAQRRTPEQEVAALSAEVQDARDAVDIYMDQTPMDEVAIGTVRSMVENIGWTLWRWRCYDVVGSDAARRSYVWWAQAVERELAAEQLRRSCVAYCEREARPPCAPEQCVVAEAR